MKYLDAVERWFLASCMLLATLLLFTNVTLRYFFQSSIFWAEEMLRYLIVWITFIGAATCVKEDSHIGIDVLANFLSAKKQVVLKIFLNIIGLIFSSFFLYVSINLITRIKGSGQVSATIGNVPMYIVYSCFPIGFFLYVIRSVESLHTLKRKLSTAGRS